MFEWTNTRIRALTPRTMAFILILATALAWPSFTLAAESTQGFIYGRVTIESGTVYEGRLRWNGDEEAFWGDLFNSTKEEQPWHDQVSEEVLDKSRDRDRDRDRGRDRSIRIMGIRIRAGSSGWSGGHTIRVRFGDIAKIETRRGDEAILTMRNGTEVEVDGGSNDLGSKVYVWDKELGEIRLDWDKIDTIEFMDTPADLKVDEFRLHGKVKTDAGDFEGYIQWDQEEALSEDELDGDSRDGDMSIPMGNIRVIERRSRGSSRVVMKSGRELVLDGTNDVDNDNRGIFVEDARFGRVLVSWDAFESVEFADPGSSGPAYEDFEAGKSLRGKVTDRDGKTHSGRIIYDLDESETWEILSGDWRDVEYNIPFGLIRSIEPRDDDSSRITLRGGEEVVLEDSADVDDSNSGILVLPNEGDAVYVDWDDVDRIDFDN